MNRKVSITILSSLLMGIGINGFIIPIHLINGGFWGVSLILNYLLGFHIAITFICLNVPIYLVASVYDKTYFINGLLGITLSSIIIALLTPLQLMIHLPTLYSTIFGGTIIGIGVGFMLREHISPGGIDLLALIFSKLFSINVGVTLLLLDSLIILFGVFTLKDLRLFYSMLVIIFVGITSTVITGIKHIKLYM
ncbi:YitT family protein [Peribacillus sp. NPDC097895]|uniref:YitT family protein n=1 Tax=Peribacillus sp. NPDC097895 TaxID=3390619 RepID=UPI003D01E2EB